MSIFSRCKKYQIPLWQCPDFFFLLIGLIIVFLILIAYALTLQFFEDPRVAALLVLAVASVLLIVAFIINTSLERLVKTFRMETEFVRIVSHHLRAPISNLKWGVEFLILGKVGKLEPNQLEYLEILRENSKRLENLVNDLLMVSKIDSGTLSLKKEKFSLQDLTLKVIKEFLTLAQSKGIKIIHSFEQIPPVFADSYYVKQVIANLLDNAIRYSKEGIINIKIEKRNEKAYFEIKDQGIGIPEEEKKYIFQKFFRAENGMKYQTSGTGLGLYISKAIVEKSGGKIGFQSQKNKGSTFWFTLPIK